MLKFISFGSGSSGNCYYLYTETDALLIDAGVGIRKLKKHFHDYGLKLNSIHNILITHDHADHVKSVGSLSQSLNVPVYSTKSIHSGIYKNWGVRKKVPATNQYLLQKGESIKIGEFLVTSFMVPHDSTDCIGFKIECNGIVFSIITDCGHVTEEISKIVEISNYLVVEANYDPEMLIEGPYPKYLKDRIMSPTGHLSNNECGQLLAEYTTSKLRHVWLCHLSEENNHPELARKSVEAAIRNTRDSCDSFTIDVLKRKIPSEIFEL